MLLTQHAQYCPSPGKQLGFNVLLKDTLKWKMEDAAGAQNKNAALTPGIMTRSTAGVTGRISCMLYSYLLKIGSIY